MIPLLWEESVCVSLCVWKGNRSDDLLLWLEGEKGKKACVRQTEHESSMYPMLEGSRLSDVMVGVGYQLFYLEPSKSHRSLTLCDNYFCVAWAESRKRSRMGAREKASLS